MNSYNNRYADNWLTELVPRAHKACKGICCHCHRRPSKQIHHVRYQRNGKAIAGYERVDGDEEKDAYGLCEDCHKQKAHATENWRRVKDNPELNNHNTDEFINRLRIGLELTEYVL